MPSQHAREQFPFSLSLSLSLSLSYFLMKLMMMVVVVASKDGLQLNVRSTSQWEPYTAIDTQFRLFTFDKEK